jgi:hypothetical protein
MWKLLTSIFLNLSQKVSWTTNLSTMQKWSSYTGSLWEWVGRNNINSLQYLVYARYYAKKSYSTYSYQIVLVPILQIGKWTQIQHLA